MKNTIWNSIRTPEQLDLMRKSGQITAAAMKKTLDAVKPGITLLELDRIAEEEMVRLGGKPAFKTVPGYHFATCLNLNDEVVHGLPRPIKLAEGDLLSVDLGASYQGWITDSSWSMVVGKSDSEQERFLAAGVEALNRAISQAKAGNRIGDVSSALQETIEGAGYSIIKSLAGHGVGKALHESPEIPGYGNKNSGPRISVGNTLAIEAIYAKGRDGIYEKSDGWTLASKDGSLTGLFESTIIVGTNGPEIITDWRHLAS